MSDYPELLSLRADVLDSSRFETVASTDLKRVATTSGLKLPLTPGHSTTLSSHLQSIYSYLRSFDAATPAQARVLGKLLKGGLVELLTRFIARGHPPKYDRDASGILVSALCSYFQWAGFGLTKSVAIVLGSCDLLLGPAMPASSQQPNPVS